MSDRELARYRLQVAKKGFLTSFLATLGSAALFFVLMMLAGSLVLAVVAFVVVFLIGFVNVGEWISEWRDAWEQCHWE